MEEAKEVIYFGHVALRNWCPQALANCLIHKNLPPRSLEATLRYLGCVDEEGDELSSFYRVGVPFGVQRSGEKLRKELVRDHGISDFTEGTIGSTADDPLIVYSETLGSYDYVSAAAPLKSGGWRLYLVKPAYVVAVPLTFTLQAKFVGFAAREMGLPVEEVFIFGWRGTEKEVTCRSTDAATLEMELCKTRDFIEGQRWKTTLLESSPCPKCFQKFCPRASFLKDLQSEGDVFSI